MIKDKKDLRKYLEADRKALGIHQKFPPLFGKEIWKFQIALRKYEYHKNVKSRFQLLYKMIWHYRGLKLGFTIPPNTCDMGLNIHHYGCIVINENARIGKNCNIQQCVNIGQNYDKNNVPVIGDNVYIGPGVKIFGKIKIADGCALGAGSIVTKSFFTPNMTIVGNPAREIGERRPGVH